MDNISGKVIGIVVALIITAFALPIALNQWIDVDTSGWTGVFAPLASMWALPVIGVVLGLVVLFFKFVQGRKD